MPGGRPTKYQDAYAETAKKLCYLGATDIEIADFFDVDVRTLYRWSHLHPEFCHALKVGKEVFDERVERALVHRATGYSYDAVKIFQDKGTPVIVPYREHVPPDTTAAIFWLKNRRPQEWRDVSRQEHTGPNGGPIETKELTAAERKARIAELTAKLKR